MSAQDNQSHPENLLVADSTSTTVDSNQTPTSSPTPSQVSPTRKRKLTSVVWNHFTKKKVDGHDKAECNYCGKLLGGESRNGTKHLHDHLNICPRRKTKDIRQLILAANQSKTDRKMTVGSFCFDEEKSRKDLANMIILHEYPVSMVEHVGFRQYSASLQPLFKMVSRNTVKSDIFKIYEHEKLKIMHLIQKNQSRNAITTDMWASSNQKRGFMVITTHFIDDSWKLQSHIMRFAYVPCPHTSETLSNVLMDCLLHWNIDRRLSSLIVDNCSTNDAIIDILLDKLPRSSLMLHGALFRMRCCAHILNLVVKDGLDVIGETIERIRDSVVYWTATPKREEKFEEVAKKLQISSNKKLSLDCNTRWSSTYLMLHTAIIYKDVFYCLEQQESQYKSLLKEEDWELAREICRRLKLFYTIPELFSGTKYPTTNILFPKLCEIKMAMSQWCTCRRDVIHNMASRMLEKFNKYWNIVSGVMAISVVLDPRYKMKLLEFYFPMIYGDETPNELRRIRQLCYDLLVEYQSQSRLNKKVSHHHESSITSSVSHAKILDFEEEDPLSDYDLFVSSISSNVHVKSELDHYLEENVLPRTHNFDLLAWWKSNGIKYPTLQSIARDILAIPVSTVASESTFSTSGRIVSPHRSKLHPETLEVLMCTQSWLWTEEGRSKAESNLQTIYEDSDADGEESIACD